MFANRSRILEEVNALELIFHDFIMIKEGSIREERIQAQVIPIAMDTPYPVITSMGAKIKERNAIAVVKLVRKIGSIKASMVCRTASLLFPVCLNFLKNFART